MTESEAKTKWCPMMGNTVDIKCDEKCIASDCMWWVWERYRNDITDQPEKSAGGHCGATK